MILLLAILAGLIAGYTRARLNHSALSIPRLRLAWLVLIAVIPQLLATEFSFTRQRIPVSMIPPILVGSQVLLLLFALSNLRRPGFILLGIGLTLNLTVITLNGGWMPISPDTVTNIAPDASPGAWEIGERLGFSKDLVMPVSNTRLWALSDRFVFPGWFPAQVAFSIGDVLIAAGAFLFLFSLGAPSNRLNVLSD